MTLPIWELLRKGNSVSAHPPPVPPAQQPKHGSDPEKASVADGTKVGSQHGNSDEQGDTANVRQNTTNKGLQKG